MATIKVEAVFEFGQLVRLKQSIKTELVEGVVIGYELRPGNVILYSVQYSEGNGMFSTYLHYDFELVAA